jgi:ABC-type phosphate transport system permease subunit
VGEHIFVPVGRILFEPHRRQLGEDRRSSRCPRGIEQLQGPFTALAMIIYNWAGEAKAEFKTALAPAAIIVLMAITFLCNGVAVFLRNRYDKRW